MTEQDLILTLQDQIAGFRAEVNKLDQMLLDQSRLLDLYSDMIRNLMDYTNKS